MAELVQRSMVGGEIAPSLRARTDLAKYHASAALIENMFVRAQGGAYSRGGTRYVGQLGDMTKKGRLLPFSFNTTQSYILVFEDYKLRVVKDAGYILSGATIYETATPYAAADLARLYITQSADVLTICHPSYDPYSLNRVSETNWTLVANSYASTVTAPGALTLAAVGSGAGSYNLSYRYVVTAIDADGVESLPSPAAVITTPSLATTAGVKITWAAVTGAASYRVYKEPSSDASTGTGVYGWIGNTTTELFTDYNLAPITSDAPPSDRQPFSGAGNKPSTVTYYQQRQMFANTTNEPQALFGTQTGNFNSLRVSDPARDSDAVTFRIAARKVNEIRHMIPLNSLVMLTSGGIWKMTEGQNQVLTPSSIGFKAQAGEHGASWVPPVVVGANAVYLQDKGSRIRDLGYTFMSDTFNSSDLSVMAQHLFDDYTITEMAYTEEPYSIVWALRDDGVLLGLTYLKEQQVWAWHHHITDGVIESIAAIPEATRDALYMIVNRTVNGATVRYVERMEARDVSAVENVFCVDCGLTYNGAAATTFTGLDHLEGKAVAVVADGVEVTGLTVTAGAITLPFAASIVHVGLPFTPALETLDIDTATPTEQTVKADNVSVSRVTIEVENSLGGWVGPIKDDGTSVVQEIPSRRESDGYGAIPLRTEKRVINIEPGWSKGGGIRIEGRSPFPLAILSIIPEVDIGG